MKTKLIALALLLAPMMSKAGISLETDGVVAAPVDASKKGKLEQFIRCCDLIALNKEEHGGYRPESVLQVLKGIDLTESQIILDSENKSKAIVRIKGPSPMKLELSVTEQINSNPLYQIIAIYPMNAEQGGVE